jgi:hypothetical protein
MIKTHGMLQLVREIIFLTTNIAQCQQHAILPRQATLSHTNAFQQFFHFYIKRMIGDHRLVSFGHSVVLEPVLLSEPLMWGLAPVVVVYSVVCRHHDLRIAAVERHPEVVVWLAHAHGLVDALGAVSVRCGRQAGRAVQGQYHILAVAHFVHDVVEAVVRCIGVHSIEIVQHV